MKRAMQLLLRANYCSNSDGSARQWLLDPALIDTIGQSKAVRIHACCYSRSQYASVVLKVYESAIPTQRPQVNGAQAGSDLAITSTGSFFFDVEPPFCSRLDVVLQVGASQGSNQEMADLEVWATLILEE